MTELFDAIREDRVDSALELISSGVNVNDVDQRPILGVGNTTLHDAAALGDAELISALIAAGAQVDAQCDLGWTPLIRACNEGHLDAARRLLESGADPAICNHEGYSAFGRVPGTCKDRRSPSGQAPVSYIVGVESASLKPNWYVRV